MNLTKSQLLLLLELIVPCAPTKEDFNTLENLGYIEEEVGSYVATRNGKRRVAEHALIFRRLPNYVQLDECEEETKKFGFSKNFNSIAKSISKNALNALLMALSNHCTHWNDIDRLTKRNVANKLGG